MTTNEENPRTEIHVSVRGFSRVVAWLSGEVAASGQRVEAADVAGLRQRVSCTPHPRRW